MPAAFKRFLQVAAQVTFGTVTPIPITNLDGEGLTIEWDIEKPRSGTDTGTITIYNMSESQRTALAGAYKAYVAPLPDAVVASKAGEFITQGVGNYQTALTLARQSLVKNYGYPVTLAIGWEGIPSVVYRGDVVKLHPGKHQGVDVLTIAELGSRAVEEASMGVSFGEFVADVVIAYLVQRPPPFGFGMQIQYESRQLIKARASAQTVTANRSWAAAGETKRLVTELLATLGLEWRIVNGQFAVMEAGDLNAILTEAFVLSPGSGLLDWFETDDGQIEVLALAIPNLIPGESVLLRDSVGKPIGSTRHRVDSARFVGSTIGHNTMTVRCRKIGAI